MKGRGRGKGGGRTKPEDQSAQTDQHPIPLQSPYAIGRWRARRREGKEEHAECGREGKDEELGVTTSKGTSVVAAGYERKG
jgi:hypothetical protein